MTYKKIIIDSLKESFKLLWRKKALVLLSIILQIMFFIIFFYLNLIYQPKILANANAIIDYISQLKLDDVSIADNILQQKSILGEDPLLISRNFNEMLRNFKLYLMYLFILFVVFTSISWMIMFKLILVKKFSSSMRIFLRLFVILLFYLGLIFSFFYSLFNISLTQIAVQGLSLFMKYIPFLIISIILIYFMFISLALSHNTELKDIVKKTLKIGVKKGHYMLTVYLINISLMAISLISLIYLHEKILMALPSIFFIILSFIFGRMFMVEVVERIS